MKGLFLAMALAAGGLAIGARANVLPDLTGRVVLPEGRSARATILVLGANLKLEASFTNRYPRLPMRAQTDAQGNFKFEAIDAAWLYYVVVVAPGCRQHSVPSFDPTSGPLVARLEAVDSSTAAADTFIRGRVVDSAGEPVPDALIRIQEVTRDGRWYFSPADIDSFAIADEAGNFIVQGQKAFADVGGAVEAPGFATRLFEHWAAGDTVHELILTKGACFQGRLLGGGKPVENADVRLDSFGAEAGSEAWRCSALTDAQGRFVFSNLPPNRKFRLYATIGSLGERGSLPILSGKVHGDGTTNDIGDLTLAPGYRIAGRIRLTDGKAVPSRSRLILARSGIGGTDSWTAVGPDGGFSFIGVPVEKIAIYLRIPGYELTARDRLLISGSATNYTVAGNMTNLVIEMRPESHS
jgi:uncharacterized GH25 family protein